VSSGFEVFDFSHERVKRVVRLFAGFVFTKASALCRFLYLNQRIPDDQKNKNRKTKLEKEKSPISLHLSRPLHLQ